MIQQSFTKIVALGTRPVLDIFDDEVEITEKLDGSQFSFGKLDGVLCARSKSANINVESPMDLFRPAVAYVKSVEEILPDNVVFYGEAFKRPKHNTLAYDNIPKNHIALFGVWHKATDTWLPYADILKYAVLLNVDIVKLMYRTRINKDTIQSVLTDALEQTSQLGGCKIEGVVIKNYRKQMHVANDIYAPIMCAKYVSEAFKEVHRGRWGKEETGKGKLETFFDSFNTTARFEKAVIHLKERGVLTDSPKDIGMLIEEVINDITVEEKTYVMEFLWSIHRKSLMSAATKCLPMWYKHKLLDNMGGM